MGLRMELLAFTYGIFSPQTEHLLSSLTTGAYNSFIFHCIRLLRSIIAKTRPFRFTTFYLRAIGPFSRCMCDIYCTWIVEFYFIFMTMTWASFISHPYIGRGAFLVHWIYPAVQPTMTKKYQQNTWYVCHFRAKSCGLSCQVHHGR